MGWAPYGDVTVFYHGIVALFVPIGWVLILYPYWRLHRSEWYKTLIFVSILSLSAMVAKEIYLDREISPDDIAADLIGLFFGTGLVSIILYMGMRFRVGRRETTSPIVPHRGIDTTGEMSHEAETTFREVSLRHIMGALKRLHEHGASFYRRSAEKLADPKKKELLLKLAQIKRDHAQTIAAVLDRWPNKRPDVTFLDLIDKRIEHHRIFFSTIPPHATDREIVDFAADQEAKIRTLFSAFSDYFRGYSWRTTQFENMILDLKKNENDIKQLH